MLPVLFRPNWSLRPGRSVWVDRWGADVGRAFDQLLGTGEKAFAPYRVDAWEDEHNVYLAADVPGFQKDELDISVEDGVLTISGDRKGESERKDEHYHVRERRFDRLERRFRLPESVGSGEVEAILKDGVLTITLKKAEASKPRKIDVTDGVPGEA
ncbi:MAG: Hsp20/alpha crystallin family protein [Phycisphaerae bacterium]|nr:Hsp20/alpha crystallin family protein [Phycisphaerae bacterium]